jgi:hypothetical protein
MRCCHCWHKEQYLRRRASQLPRRGARHFIRGAPNDSSSSQDQSLTPFVNDTKDSRSLRAHRHSNVQRLYRHGSEPEIPASSRKRRRAAGNDCISSSPAMVDTDTPRTGCLVVGAAPMGLGMGRSNRARNHQRRMGRNRRLCTPGIFGCAIGCGGFMAPFRRTPGDIRETAAIAVVTQRARQACTWA